MWKSTFIIAIAVFVTACGRVPTAPNYSDRQDAVVQEVSEVDDSKGGKEYQESFHTEDASTAQQASAVDDSMGGKEYQTPFHTEDESIVQQATRVDDSKGGKEYQVSFQCTENATEGSVTR